MVSERSLKQAIKEWVYEQDTGNFTTEEAIRVVDALAHEYLDLYLDMSAEEIKEETDQPTVVEALKYLIEDELAIDFRGSRWSSWGKAGTFFSGSMAFILNEDEAERIAIEVVRQELEYEPYLFDWDWLVWHIDEDRAEQVFRQIYDEWNYNYAYDIADESDSEYGNRLIREMVECGIVDEDEVLDEDGEVKEDFDYEDYIDDFVDCLTDRQIDEGSGGLEHYRLHFGDEMARKVIEDWNLIDIDEASEDAVAIDGWAHFLSLYDGSYDVIKNGVVVFRED